MTRKALVAAAIAVTMTFFAAELADAKTVTSSVVRGRIYWGAQVAGTTTRFTQMSVYGALPGGSVSLSCRSSCPIQPQQRPVPANGVVRLDRFVRGRAWRAGAGLDVAIADPQGRRKVLAYRFRRAAIPRRDLRCFAPDGSEIACTVGCLVGAQVPPGDPCEGAGQVTRIPRSLYRWFARWTHVSTHFTRLRVKGLPSGVDVLLLCRPRKGLCPVGLRALEPHRGFVDIAKALHGANFTPGSAFEVQFVRANTTTEILRFLIRDNRKPRVKKLCQGPADPEPHGC